MLQFECATIRHADCTLSLTSTTPQEINVTHISFVVPPNYRAGSDASQVNKNRDPNDPNMVTTGAYGGAFELALNTTTGADGTTTDTLTYESYDGKTNGSFSAVSEMGSGSNLSSAYQSLFSAMQANGEMSDATASQLKDAFDKLQAKSDGGAASATVSGGEMITVAGPLDFQGISAYQNSVVDSVINDLTSELSHDSVA